MSKKITKSRKSRKPNKPNKASDKPRLRGKALMRAIINKIITDPEHWNQGQYHSQCGTKHCFAGWGEVLGLPKGVKLELESKHTHNRTKRYLGLTKKEAEWLFVGYRNFNEIYQFVVDFLKGKRWKFDYYGEPILSNLEPSDFKKL